jgi:predicted DNA-binding transcriptional regulator YafY
VIDGVQVRLHYSDRTRSESERTVHPLGLVAKGNVWYLLAGTDAGLRTFRVGRVRSLVVTDQPVERPDDFDLAETWKSVVATVEERRAAFRAVALVDPWVIYPLRAQFGTACVVGEQTPDGRLEVEIGGMSAEMIADHLAGYGRYVEVLRPDEVRDHLARIGAELVDRYGTATA